MKPFGALLALALTTSVWAGEVTVSTIAPASGLTRGGEIVHVHGTGMFDLPLLCPAPFCSTYVYFGTTPATILNITSTDLVVVAPPHAAGVVDVEVHLSGSSSVILKSSYVYQEPQSTDQVRMLVPIAAGAGTWQVDLSAYNGSSEALTIGSTQIAAYASKNVTLTPAPGNAGIFVYVPKRMADSVTWNLRVHDTSRDTDGWGVDIPVVPESQFGRSVVLSGIPSDARFRTLLRIYSFAGPASDAQVTLRDDTTGELLDARTVTLGSGAYTQRDVAAQAPAYTQLALDPLLHAGHARVRAEVTGASSDAPPLWAFVSVTNNVTQQVTTVTPAIAMAAGSVPTPSSLPFGTYGGSDCVRVDSKQVTIGGCIFGSFDYPTLGPDHRFEAGLMVTLGGVPTQPMSAHISGVLQGDLLTLQIRTGLWTQTITDKLGVACGPFCP